MQFSIDVSTGIANNVVWQPSPNFDDREPDSLPEVIIIHCISLPPGDYGGGEISRFFKNELSPDEHPYFKGMAHLTVSAHFLIDRFGRVTQFVSTDKRAWHAGDSVCFERPKVNDFSIGIELESWDEDPSGYTDAQYTSLRHLIDSLRTRYSGINSHNVFAHSDIAPGRKPDPGPFFDWNRLFL